MEKKSKNIDAAHGFMKLYEIVEKLRGENGCAWDKEQTPHTLLPNLLEEAYELVEAVEDSDEAHIREELGDLFLLVVMISYIKQEEKKFALSDVFTTISEKLIRRHPHVFGDISIDNPDSIIRQWNEIKKNVEGRDNNGYITDSVPKTLPPLEKALKLQKKVANYGFDWNSVHDVIDKLQEEIDELREAMNFSDGNVRSDIEDELGDILFSAINIGRFLKIDPSLALHGTIKKFIQRFSYIEDKCKEKGIELSKENLKNMETFWNDAKNKTKKDFPR